MTAGEQWINVPSLSILGLCLLTVNPRVRIGKSLTAGYYHTLLLDQWVDAKTGAHDTSLGYLPDECFFRKWSIVRKDPACGTSLRDLDNRIIVCDSITPLLSYPLVSSPIKP